MPSFAAIDAHEPSPLSRRVALLARWQAAVVVVVIAVPAAIVASFVPYRHWDSMAFGTWSRLIASTGDLFPAGLSPAILHRPLFYVAQGLAWRWLDDGEWVGRWLSLLLSAAFVAAVWLLARRLAGGAPARALVPSLAVSVALASSVFAVSMVAGLSDVPVAATSAVTAVALLAGLREAVRLPLVAAAALATVLAKPTGLVALAGVALAALLVLWAERRRMSWGLAALAVGAAAGLGYHAWQAHRLGIPLTDELRSGNSDFWLERGAATRADAVLRAEWLGAGVRLAVLAGLLFSVGRVTGAGPRRALAVAAAGAPAIALLGPLAAGDGLGYPFSEPSWLGAAVWLGLVATLGVAAAVTAGDDVVPRRVHAALLAWTVPGAAAWLLYRADEPRFLTPVWAPVVLMAACALGVAALALARLRPWLALVPATVLTVAVVANVVAIDGLGHGGWRELVREGPSGWTDRAAMENLAYGAFADELALVRETAGDGGIVSSDSRLPYFFPGRVRIRYPVSCAEVERARLFVLLLGDESVELMRRAGGTADPLAWEQCATPHLTSVGAIDGIYAAFVVGAPPSQAPTSDDCRISGTPGTLLDGVFADGVTYAVAKAVRASAAAVGYTVAHIERTGCGTYRVVVTGIPTPRANQEDFLRESSGAGFAVVIRDPVRYPEVPADVEPVPSR